MKRLIYALGLCVALLFGSQQRASAQFATFDASKVANCAEARCCEPKSRAKHSPRA